MLNANRFIIFAVTAAMVSVLSSCDKLEGLTSKLSKKDSSPKASQKNASKKMGPMPADAVARVGDWVLTKKEYEERLEALKELVPEYDDSDEESRRLVLEELVRQELLIKDAEDSGFAQSEDIEEAVEEFRRTLIVREVVQQKTENITVTEEEAREFYKQNENVLIEPLELDVSEIVVETEDKAKQILASILQGADFSEAARANSISESASEGGSLGFITEVSFPQMGNALMTLEEGGVSNVFKGPEGFYIVKVNEKRGGELIPFEELKEQIIENQKRVKQQQAVLEYINGLRNEYKVEINEDLI